MSQEAIEPQPATQGKSIWVPSGAQYHGLRDALAKNKFARDPHSEFPMARLTAGRSRGHAWLKPAVLDQPDFLTPEYTEMLAQAMWEQRKEIGDMDADVLDALSHIWLARAKSSDSKVVASVDELLYMRGLKPKLSGQQRRGGYTRHQRAVILKALTHLHNMWVRLEWDFTQVERRRNRHKPVCESRPFIITDTFGQLRLLDNYLDVEAFIFAPGSVFGKFLWGPGRRVAELSAKALHYDPYRQKWGKRLARYFSWQWRIRARSQNFEQPYRIDTLLGAVGENLDRRNPGRTRARLQRALDMLQDDSVIGSWHYKDRWDEQPTPGSRWDQWMNNCVIVTPPAELHDLTQGVFREKHLGIIA